MVELKDGQLFEFENENGEGFLRVSKGDEQTLHVVSKGRKIFFVRVRGVRRPVDEVEGGVFQAWFSRRQLEENFSGGDLLNGLILETGHRLQSVVVEEIERKKTELAELEAELAAIIKE